MSTPLISVVTPSFNQAAYIEDTIRSVLEQDYPNWEHIVIDGGSTDGTLDILARYPHLRWISEKDHGQGDALNKGFRMARGDIIGWLNSDDTYLPGALSIVARELDRARRRYVVVGNCEFIDDRTPTGIYHPRAFSGHRRVIEIWKGYSIPQPAVFFYQEVLDRCGGLDENLYLALDYDLFLRFSKRYWFHLVDATLATYRLHGESKTVGATEADLLQRCVEVSRRYWGPPYSPVYWYYWLTYHAHRSPLRFRANQSWSRAVREAGRQRYAAAAGWLALAVVLFPPLVWRRGQFPAFELAKRVLGAERARRWAGLTPRGATAIEGTVFADGWVSDYAVVRCHSIGPASWVAVEGSAVLAHFSGTPLRLRVRINDLELGEYVLRSSGAFRARFPLPEPLRAVGRLDVRIEPDKVFVPWELGVSQDRRRLSFLLDRVYACAE